MFLDKLKAYAKTVSRAGEVPELFKLLVRRPAILVSVGVYETALLASSRTGSKLKALAMLKTSSLVGCPF